MTKFFAKAMLQAIRDGHEWMGEDRHGKPVGDVQRTIEIHRDWLMTPCAELDGGIPRDRLHIGKEWISDLVENQLGNLYQGELPFPISVELSTFESAPMGRHEVIIYFEACREALAAGWRWLIADPKRCNRPRAEIALARAMDKALQLWLQRPTEGGASPIDAILCERLRVPLIDPPEQHELDCDCPICEMMADGRFGPSIVVYDGHQLELDDEFAFSICATREEWEEQRQVWAAMNASIDERLERSPSNDESGDEQFGPIWQGVWTSEEKIPGDSTGQLGLAFLVADMVGSLQASDAPKADIKKLNAAFRDYRDATPNRLRTATNAFKQTLESLAGKHDYLVSRSADLQSQLEELVRSTTSGDFAD
jgi:hypothetical protein